MGQESGKGSAEHLVLGVLMGVPSDAFWDGCHLMAPGTMRHVQDGSLTQLAPGVCPRLAGLKLVTELLTSIMAASGIWASSRTSVQGEPGRSYTAFFYLALAITSHPFPCFPLVTSEPLTPAQIKGEGT